MSCALSLFESEEWRYRYIKAINNNNNNALKKNKNKKTFVYCHKKAHTCTEMSELQRFQKTKPTNQQTKRKTLTVLNLTHLEDVSVV